MQSKISCEQAKLIDLVDYLASLGYFPKKIRNQDYWYNSPFRQEATPSFKVNKSRNIWFDFGQGKGGDLIDFGVQYFKSSVGELLERLSGHTLAKNLSFHPPISDNEKSGQSLSSPGFTAGEKKEPSTGKILILDEQPLASIPLLQYFQKRQIPIQIAERFCKQIDFLLYGKKHTAIGFQNNAGGYELRNQYFKGSSSPKDITFFANRQKEQLAVFEGFFNFLSYQAIQQSKSESLITLPNRQGNFLVLNSLSFFEKSREKMEDHRHIHLFLDRDKSGIKWTEEALKWSDKYIDQSALYKVFKDLNEFLIKYQEPELKERLRHGRHF
jgi:hypothetical protein